MCNAQWNYILKLLKIYDYQNIYGYYWIKNLRSIYAQWDYDFKYLKFLTASLLQQML